MIKLNKKTEYALLAMRYLHGRRSGEAVSVKAIAAHYAIPEVLLGKVLQKLKRRGILDSVKGAAGGYLLAQPLSAIHFVELLDAFNESVALVDCLQHPNGHCAQEAQCDIRRPLEVLNEAILGQFRQLTLAELLTEQSQRPQALSIFRS